MAEGSSRFTAPEGGARLASAARHRNTLAVELAAFTSTRLVHEQAFAIRGPLSSGKQRSVYIARATRVPCVAYELNILTDLAVSQAVKYEDVESWPEELEVKEVLVCTSSVMSRLLREELLTMPRINVLVIDSCHLIHADEELQFIMKQCKSSDQQPRILALTYPLFAAKKSDDEDSEKMDPEDKNLEENEPDPESEDGKAEPPKEREIGVCPNVDDFDMYSQLEWKIDQLERQLGASMDLAEDIDGGKRFSAVTTKPRELIVQYNKRGAVCQQYSQLEQFMRTCVADVLQFLGEHRYDPTEIYGEDLYEEFKSIPDPTIEPTTIFKEFLYVLDEVGPYGADKAAFSLLIKLEKLKIKVPYERHFLLLCVCTTVFVKIRSYADFVFSEYSELDRITTFSTAKVLRFIEVLAQFENTIDENNYKIGDDKNLNGNVNDARTETIDDKLDGDFKNVITANHNLNDVNNDKLITNGTDYIQTNELQETQEDIKSEQKSNVTSKMLNDINNCDFISLCNKIEDKVNTYEANLKEIHDLSIENRATADSNSDHSKNIKHVEFDCKNPELDSKNTQLDSKNTHLDSKNTEFESNASKFDCKFSELDPSDPRSILGIPRRSHRLRGRGRVQRNVARCQQNQQNPDALCGIVFMNEPIMAKIMFLIVVELSRSDPRLSHLCAQYCAAAGASGAPPAELRAHCRAREDALKKFRMHECNLLLATSALEEGIDLPRCNLVLRWDVPPSYRSAGLCRGRARAPRAACVLLCASGEECDTLLRHECVYRELDQLISRKCGCGIQDEPPPQEEDHADSFTALIQPYSPSGGNEDGVKETQDNEYNDDRGVIDAKRNKCDDDLKSEVIEETVDELVKGVKCNDNDERVNNGEIVDSNIDVQSNESANKCKNEISVVENVDKDKESSFRNNKSKMDSKCEVTKAKEEKSENVVGGQINVNNTNKINQLEEKNSKTKTDSDNLGVNLVCNKCDKKRTSTMAECCVEKSDSFDRVSAVKKEEIASVDLSSAIALINRYCSKLPSDTFTRLAPSCRTERVRVPAPGGWADAYVCTLRLPLNCPVKYNIVGHPMPTRALARRAAALQACRVLHRAGELDSQLQPIGKENFKAAELENTYADSCPDARPGTTKRRQYYYKRTARAFTNCEPVVDATEEQISDEPPTEQNTSANILYCISCALWCALPERYNTRGRRLHAPQHARQAVGVLMRTGTPNSRLQIPVFPVYTRSGEVRAQVSPCAGADTRLSPRRAELVRGFMRFVFAEVLRVRRRGMSLQSEGSTHNNYYVVPTHRVVNPDGSTRTDIDWKFLEQIQQYTEEKRSAELEKPMVWRPGDDDGKEDSPEKPKVKKMDNPLLKPGETFVFDADKYREAVVTPWYRNQDQPQFFLVAEICWNLTPDSEFPSAAHKSFREYYSSKYGVSLTQPAQPLLDVDHTSARLNLLTPRYVNRKGVALPVSSERTRRAKRDRLDQKQILVPELCCVHPFAAPLWFATVALPCVLYRINALLIADEIRRRVALDVALGIPRVEQCAGFQWPPLDFGWSLAEVLSADSEKNEKKKENDADSIEDSSELKEEEAQIEKEDSTEQNENGKTINDILQEKEDAESGFEIGMWDNKMASSIPPTAEYDELMEPLPPNLTFCTSASGGVNWCAPTPKPRNAGHPPRTFSMADSDCSYMSSDFDTDDSDLNSEGSDDTETSGFCSSKSNAAMGVRIEYKTAHEAEAVDLERRALRPAPLPSRADDARDAAAHRAHLAAGAAPTQYLEKFHKSVAQHKKEIIEKGLLIAADRPIVDLLPDINKEPKKSQHLSEEEKRNKFEQLFPYKNEFLSVDNSITIEDIEKNKRALLMEFKKTLTNEEIKKLTCFSMIDVDIDSPEYRNEKVSNIGFDTKEAYEDKVNSIGVREFKPYFEDNKAQNGKEFDFDYQPDLEGHPGPSPSVILQGLTMSNANDGINLERLETIGDSFLKFAITAYLYCAHPTVHEGKLSHMRSKQVSNLNLYRLGLRKRLGARMIASKFEPHDNWLPPCHRAPPAAHAPVDSEEAYNSQEPAPATGCFIPYNLITQHSIPDKSIADCVEALIGAYLLECGPRGALLFMAWLGIRVLPRHELRVAGAPAQRLRRHKQRKQARKPTKRVRQDSASSSDDDPDDMSPTRPVGSLEPYQDEEGQWILPVFGELKAPPSPLLRYIEDPEGELEQMLSGYDALERTLQYRFRDRALLLQALTHASHQQNRLTDCYQRLEFLGDAILDYLITRHLYEDPRRHSPGALTDLRSALVNNTIFATLAARHGFHKYFRHMSPGLNEVLTRYVKIQEENGHSISEEHYLIHEDEMEQAEDVEVPKALGDLFESVAGAIFLDSGMSLGAVWRSYELLMGAELEAFSAAAPKSPVRELLEAEPDTAKFGKPERLADGRRVRVCVEVFGRGAFKGVGRNYRIAKGTAARCALRHLKRHKQH